MRVLTIGNSFANNATMYLEEMTATAQGDGIIIGKTNLGGCSLEKHWNLVEQCDLLPEVKPYGFQVTGAGARPATLREALVSAPWDYVTLQQASILSWRPETYFPYLARLVELIQTLAPQAQLVIHQTWAYRNDAPLFKEQALDQAAMYERLNAAYQDAAKKINARLIPVGAAFQMARQEMAYSRDRQYNFNDPQPLELPHQANSLIVGYYWQTGNTPSGKAELTLDAKHANAKGCYLGNAVWYEMFTGAAVADHPFCPQGITADEWALLKKAAHAAVEAFGGPL